VPKVEATGQIFSTSSTRMGILAGVDRGYDVTTHKLALTTLESDTHSLTSTLPWIRSIVFLSPQMLGTDGGCGGEWEMGVRRSKKKTKKKTKQLPPGIEQKDGLCPLSEGDSCSSSRRRLDIRTTRPLRHETSLRGRTVWLGVRAVTGTCIPSYYCHHCCPRLAAL
jgi:hypothetical protein